MQQHRGVLLMNLDKIKAAVRNVPNFPKPGIIYKDITPLLQDRDILSYLIKYLADNYREQHPDYIAGIEARGFILGAAMAVELGCGFVPIRKKGKLPYHTLQQSYSLEYGEATIEVHTDAFPPGAKVVLVDDLLATGGTASAAVTLLNRLKANIIGIEFIIDLAFLHGRECLQSYPVRALITEN
jgi:adenine phosphoribosyltransferase